MILTLIAAYRGKRAFKKFGYDHDNNPYTPSTRTVHDCWSAWYWAHQQAYYDSIGAEQKGSIFDDYPY